MKHETKGIHCQPWWRYRCLRSKCCSCFVDTDAKFLGLLLYNSRYHTVVTGYLYQIKKLNLALMQLYFINLMTRFTFIILCSSSCPWVRGLNNNTVWLNKQKKNKKARDSRAMGSFGHHFGCRAPLHPSILSWERFVPNVFSHTVLCPFMSIPL